MQYLRENICVGVLFLIKLLTLLTLLTNLIKKRLTTTQVFFCGYCETFKNTYFEEHLRTAAFAALPNTVLPNAAFAEYFLLQIEKVSEYKNVSEHKNVSEYKKVSEYKYVSEHKNVSEYRNVSECKNMNFAPYEQP